MTTDEFLAQLAACLRGPRRHRQRLIEEIGAHIDDALHAELARNTNHEEAEQVVLDRFGDADTLARHWNKDRYILRVARRRRLAAVAFAAVAAGALGITQYAAGKPQLRDRTTPQQTTPKRVPAHTACSAKRFCVGRLKHPDTDFSGVLPRLLPPLAQREPAR
jgi:hypothetical protein